ncbi:MAG: HEAT repeat domain-containing protein [Rhodoferax sp.]|nr:HEAT repeat domain-containing protein [Rhodoferax sp.]
MAIVKRSQTQSVDSDERARPRDLAGLIALLQDPNPTARRWAARDLCAFPDAAAALVARLPTETESAVREAILMALTEIGGTVAVAGLVECLRSDDAALRCEAIGAMKLLPDAVAPIMEGLLEDANPDVRIFAVNVLESLRHPDVEKWLLKVIDQDPHINVCATAVDLLGEVGTSDAIAALNRLEQRFAVEPYIVFAADLALKRIQES